MLENLCRLLDKDGLLKTNTFETIRDKILTMDVIKNVKSLTMDLLAAVNPAAADMLTNSEQVVIPIPFYKKAMFWREQE